MRFNTVICTSCGRRLTVSENAPRALICPKCFSHVENQFGGSAGTAPRPVIPIERQVQSDTTLSRIIAIVVALLATLGVGMLVLTKGMRGPGLMLLILVVLGVAAGVALALIPRKKDSDFREEMGEPPPLSNAAGSAVVELPTLDYRGPRRVYSTSEPANIGAVIGGFLLAIGVCAGGFVLLGSTFGDNPGKPFYLLLVILAVIGVIVAAAMLSGRPGWKGFGLAVTVGLMLGLLALGPCGFCYLISMA